MLVNVLPEKTGKVLTDNGSSPALTTGQKAALIDGVENSGGVAFGGSFYGNNLLTGGTVTASDEYNSTYAAAKAADGSAATWWETTGAEPHWWKYLLASAKTVTKLRIKCGHIYGLKNFTLDGSNDNTNWTTVYTGQAAQVTTWQDFTFSNSTAYLYYRINGSDVWVATNSFRIQEFEMYDSTPGSLNFKLDITGGGNAPVNEVRYFTTETDTAKVTIKTSTDNASWTTRTTASGGSGWLKAAVGAAVRYVTIDHPSSASQTSYEIEVITQRCPRPVAPCYGVRAVASRWAAATYHVVYTRTSAKFIGSGYSVFQRAIRPETVNYRIRQAAARRETVSYRIRQAVAKRWDARWHIRPPAPILLSAADAAVSAIIAGLLRTGATSAEVQFHLWNSRGGGAELLMGNITITAALENGRYSGGSYPQGQEVVDGKWIELKSAGVTGFGAVDDAQAGFTPVGGDPAAGGLEVGSIPAGAGRVITMRINVPASPATPFSAAPRLAVNFEAFDVSGMGGYGANYGSYYGE